MFSADAAPQDSFHCHRVTRRVPDAGTTAEGIIHEQCDVTLQFNCVTPSEAPSAAAAALQCRVEKSPAASRMMDGNV